MTYEKHISDEELKKTNGYMGIVMGLIMLLSALTIIFKLAGQKNIKFLRFMLIIIATTSLLQIIYGCIVLKLISLKKWKEDEVTLYYTVKGVILSLYDTAAWTIIWHISFKYWETSRQFTRMIRIVKENSNREPREENGTPESSQLVQSAEGQVKLKH